jgi:hypothetical protein
MSTDESLRRHLLELLDGGSAHVKFDDVIADWPAELRGRAVPGVPYTPWQILEHMRIAQWDILEFSRNAKHVSPQWPAGYWPPTGDPPDDKAWDGSVEVFHADLAAMRKLVADPAVDLFAKIPHGEGQTVLREAMLVADHNAYHLGQLVLVRRALGGWKD